MRTKTLWERLKYRRCWKNRTVFYA